MSDPILSQIAANTGGYLLVTGNLANDVERFTLAKYFIQILKDATLQQTVVDPQGLLLWNGQPQSIPFAVADTDVSIDVVVLCPLPAALDFQLLTPSGQLITPETVAVEPNVRYVVGPDVVYYRLLLPVFPGNPAGSHRGTWHALLRLRKIDEVLEEIRKHQEDRAVLAELIRRLRQFAERAMPFNLSVHAYSNLTLDATARQDSFAPGAVVHLDASLWEYRVPLRTPAVVWADVVQPDGSTAQLSFSPSSVAGAYTASWTTTRPGVYSFRVRAEGHTTSNARFAREKVLTAGVWAGGDRPYDPQVDEPHGDDRFCHLLHCLLAQLDKSDRLQERLKDLGIDPFALRECIAAYCRTDRPDRTVEGVKLTTESRPETATGTRADELRRLLEMPEVSDLLLALAPGGLADVASRTAAVTTTPVRRRPKLPGTPGNLFLLPASEEGRKEGREGDHEEGHEEGHEIGHEEGPDEAR